MTAATAMPFEEAAATLDGTGRQVRSRCVRTHHVDRRDRGVLERVVDRRRVGLRIAKDDTEGRGGRSRAARSHASDRRRTRIDAGRVRLDAPRAGVVFWKDATTS